jgi:SAM-dependent methyltransferase
MRSATDPVLDPLRPSPDIAGAAWATRVRAGREQIARLREVGEPDDFYAPSAKRFGQDPHRTNDAALDVLRSMARADETWLDIGAGGGRYALPLALFVKEVVAIEPSPAMLAVLREGMATHDIVNVRVVEGTWPIEPRPVADVALMAHVGYDIESFSRFLDVAESAARRCVVVMRASGAARASHALWPDVHGEPRVDYPMLPELLTLLVARGGVPEVKLVQRGDWGFDSREQLVEAARRLLWVRPDGPKGRLVERLVLERATERDGQWEYDWTPMPDGIVSWRTDGAGD